MELGKGCRKVRPEGRGSCLWAPQARPPALRWCNAFIVSQSIIGEIRHQCASIFVKGLLALFFTSLEKVNPAYVTIFGLIQDSMDILSFVAVLGEKLRSAIANSTIQAILMNSA